MGQDAIEWLDEQCRSIDTVRAGAMLLADDTVESGDPQLFQWPQDANVSSNLVKIARSAMQRNKPRWTTVNRPEDEGGSVTLLAYPLTYNGEVRGAVTVECDEREEQQRVHAIRTLQSASANLLASDENAPTVPRFNRLPLASVGGPLQQHMGRQSELLSLIVEALDHDSLWTATSAVVNELAGTFECRRVSLGINDGNSLRVHAISNSAEFDAASTPVRMIAATMQETIENQSTVIVPANGDQDPELIRAHIDLVEDQDDATVCSIGLVADRQMFGAIVLERNANQPFDDETTAFLEQVALLIGPVLELKRQAELTSRQRIWASCKTFLASTLGPRHLTSKLTTTAVIAIAAWLAIAPGQYRITAEATLEPTSKFAVTAPFDGFIAASHKKAGEVVAKGETLVTLDQGDMLLEQTKWKGEYSKLSKEYRSALAKRDRTEVRILKNRQEQVQTQLNLLNILIERGDMVAPIDGMIIQGDLDEVGGSPVERGQLLFEIARLDDYRVELKVDERDIASVEQGQTGRLLLASLPNKPMEFVVNSIVPISESDSGINAFSVYATLVDQSSVARPGMAGIAKIDLGSRSLLWIYTHRLVDWIRLQWWRFV